MRVALINMLHFGSTGKIMFGIANVARENGYEAYTFSPRYYEKGKKTTFPEKEYHQYFGTRMENRIHHHIARITGFNGCFSYLGTKELLKQLDRMKPDIVHLHNLHNWTLNLPILFRYIKKKNIKVVWTLHDCWSFTGQCPYFTLVRCERWKTGCYNCSQCDVYPQSCIDQTKIMWRLKRKWFTGVKNLTIVTPSQWLADLVKESFLKDYPVKVIHNGIDLSVFKPTKNNFREKYGIPSEKKVLLGVAFDWGKRKGLDVFVELAKRLGEQYQIVLVGTDDQVDQALPKNIISIHCTQNQGELAEIYSAADVFVNPTREENYPTVNMEALACGTPVIAFETGGSPEIIDETCGIVVPCDDVDAMERWIRWACKHDIFSKEACLKRAKNFAMQERFREYINLYIEVG